MWRTWLGITPCHVRTVGRRAPDTVPEGRQVRSLRPGGSRRLAGPAAGRGQRSTQVPAHPLVAWTATQGGLESLDQGDSIDLRLPARMVRTSGDSAMTPSRRHFGSVRRLPSGYYQASYWYEGLGTPLPKTFHQKADAHAFSIPSRPPSAATTGSTRSFGRLHSAATPGSGWPTHRYPGPHQGVLRLADHQSSHPRTSDTANGEGHAGPGATWYADLADPGVARSAYRVLRPSSTPPSPTT